MTARQKRKKSHVPRASLAKLSNKRLNKLSKQGKLKKAVGKKKLVKMLARRTNQPNIGIDETPEDIPLEEADYEYFAKPGRDFSFLKELKASEPKKDKKRKRERSTNYDDVEGLYNKRLKDTPENEVKMKDLLPFKSKSKGIIHRTMEVKDDEEEETEVMQDEAVDVEVETLNVPQLPQTPLEELIEEERKIKEMKANIRLLASSVMGSPQENMAKIKELLSYFDGKNPDIPMKIRRFVVITLTEVFKDIIPGYRIRTLTDTERKQSMKKETKQLHMFEESMLNTYRNYLESLEFMATGKRRRTKKTQDEQKKQKQSAAQPVNKKLRLLCVKSLCHLLLTHPHFNFRTEIIAVVLRFITISDLELSDTVCDAVKQLFAEDKRGEVSLEVVRLIGRVIKVKEFHVNPKVLNTFLSLKIKEVEKPENREKPQKMTKEERMKKFSKRERKRQKAIDYLDKELREAAAEEDVKLKLKLHTQIINSIFLTYFRILKQARGSKLLASVLEGLAKFAHLINVSFFDDLFAVLTDLVSSGELTNRCSLNCVLTASTLLMGQGEALNIDPVRFYNHLYKIILQMHAGNSSEDLPVALRCLDILLSRRRRHMSDQRLLAFIKRLATVALQMSSSGTLAVLGVVKKMISEFPRSDVLLSNDTIGSGIFIADLDEPDYCHASNTSLFELHLLRKSYHPAVESFAANLLKGSGKQ